jgi:hypothetical protein
MTDEGIRRIADIRDELKRQIERQRTTFIA